MSDKKISVEVCIGTSCHLMGSNLIIDYLGNLPEKLKSQLDIKYVTCMDKCNKGPQVKIGGNQLDNATPDMVNNEIKRMLLK